MSCLNKGDMTIGSIEVLTIARPKNNIPKLNKKYPM